MKHTKYILFFSFIAFTYTFLLGGCAINHGKFTVASDKIVRLSEFELDKADRVKGVEGKDVTHIIIAFPIGSMATIGGAIDDALEKGDGDVMTDVTIEQWFFYIPYIYGQANWHVKGDVVKTRKN